MILARIILNDAKIINSLKGLYASSFFCNNKAMMIALNIFYTVAQTLVEIGGATLWITN